MCPPLCKIMVMKVTMEAICLQAGVQVLHALGADALPGSPSLWHWHLTRLKCMSHLIATGSLWIKQRQLLIVSCILKICCSSNDGNRNESVYLPGAVFGDFTVDTAHFTQNIINLLLNNFLRFQWTIQPIAILHIMVKTHMLVSESCFW